MKRTCVACKYFRVEDVFTGRCSVDKTKIDRDKLPIMKHGDSCERFKDVGQQYYIRIGWIKSMKKKSEEESSSEQH